MDYPCWRIGAAVFLKKADWQLPTNPLGGDWTQGGQMVTPPRLRLCVTGAFASQALGGGEY